jgi:hypothetical protein
MPKVTMTFSLPEERAEHADALHGAEWKAIVYDLSVNLRNHLKYGHMFKTPDEALEAIRTLLWDDCKEVGLDPWQD